MLVTVVTGLYSSADTRLENFTYIQAMSRLACVHLLIVQPILEACILYIFIIQLEKRKSLDSVLAVRQAELERKDVQLRELVQRSGLDQATVDEICKKMEEAIEAKNSIIKNLKYSMAHATKAYNDAIRVYEAKLVEFGIPAEELGLELLETQTSDMPAGLVAA